MSKNAGSAPTNSLSELPSVDEVMRTAAGAEVGADLGAALGAELARQTIDLLRSRLLSEGAFSGLSRKELLAQAELTLTSQAIAFRSDQQRAVINATGVIIHTNLGRAPLSGAARSAIAAAAGYGSVELDLETGLRGRRGGYVEDLLCQLTGAEAALVVNNCAAAALLALTAIADGSETIISRGELVEIGGDFRIPDVLERSGGVLREVGTTNRTKLGDYENAISERTGVILRVHPSNYKIVGFTAKPSNAELSELAHRHGLIFYEDAGSGALIDLAAYGLADEPTIDRSIEDGVDLITFSGDKLVGGPQSGLIVGREVLIEKLRKHPLYRALRADKLTYAALQATLGAYIRGNAVHEIPVLQMLSLEPSTLKHRSQAFVEKVAGCLSEPSELSLSVVEDVSVVGGGSAPGVHPVSFAIAISGASRSTEEISRALRAFRTPVISRIREGKVLLDLRTVFENEEAELFDAILSIA